MDVTEQINKNECGICVINSFFNFFYKKDIKQELLNDSKIIKFGLSIYDFEVLCDKYGMKCECFSLTNEEFIELSEKKWIVCLHGNEQNHYIIFRKRKEKIEVIDSVKGRYFTNTNEFIKNFSGIVIMIEKKFKKFNLKQKIKLFNHLDTKFLIINLFLQFLIVSFSIIGSLYLTKYIGNFQTNNSFETSIWVCVFFLFIFTIENLVKYISSLLISKQIRNNCFFYSSNILKNISIKGSNFFNKIDKNYYYFIDKIIIGISSFNVITVINFIGTCFSLFLIFFIFSYISIFYTFICIFSMIIFFIFELLKYKFKLKTLRNGMKTNIDFYENGREIVEIINGYSNIYQNQKIQQDFKNNWFNFFNISKQKENMNLKIELFLNILNKVLIMICLIFITYFSVSKNIFDIFIFLAIFSIFWINCQTFTSFWFQYAMYKKFLLIYNNLINIENINYGVADLEKINEIKFENKKLRNNTLVNKEIINSFFNKKDSEKVLINNRKISDFSYESLEKSIIFFKRDFESIGYLKEVINSPLIINFIKEYKFNFYDGSIINLYLLCLTYENKILFLPKIKNVVERKKIKELIEIIKKNNFIFFYE